MGINGEDALTGEDDITIVPQSFDIFQDYREICVYRFLKDLYYGEGGVSGRTGNSENSSNIRVDLLGFTTLERAYSYLNYNPTENFYHTRIRQSVFINYYRRYVDKKFEAVFKIPPKTTVGVGNIEDMPDHPYHDFIKNINGAGMNKNQFYQNVLAAVYRDQVAFLIMDVGEEGLPYEYMQEADTVSDYDTDRFGNLTMIEFVNKIKEKKYEKLRWTDTTLEIFVSDNCKDWKLESTETLFGGMPILGVFASPRTDPRNWLPTPKSKAIAELNLSIYEAWSRLDWLVEKQGHDLFYTTGDIDGVRNGLTNILKIDGMDGNATAGILSPDANKIMSTIAVIDKKTAELFELLSDGGVLVSRNNNAPESGVAKMYTFTPVNDASLHSTMICKGMDEWNEKQYKVYNGGDFTATTHYRTSFHPTVKASLLEMSDLLRIFEDRGLVENSKDLLKKIVRTINDNEDLTIGELLNEIETMKEIKPSDDGNSNNRINDAA